MNKSPVVDWPVEIASPESVGLCPERLKRLDALLDRYVAEGRVAGVIALIARRGKIGHLNRHGVMSIETGEPMRDDALFRIYSMTKPITSAAVLMLMEEGHFLLTWPVSHFIPGFADLKVKVTGADGKEELVRPKREVTIHDLLTHMGGLTYENVHVSLEEGETFEPFIERVCRTPLLGHPGEVWRYSEADDVLGYLVEVISGMPFDEFVKQRIFDPLGMVDTDFYVPADKVGRLAQVYTEGDGGKLAVSDTLHAQNFTKKPTLPSGGGGLVSSTADYLRFALMLLNFGELNGVRILGRKTVELMADNHLPPSHPPLDVNDRGYGLGVAVSDRAGVVRAHGSIGEFGWGGAAATNTWIDPVEDMVSLFMMQHRPVARFQLSELAKVTASQAIVD